MRRLAWLVDQEMSADPASCWLWPGKTNQKGYVLLELNGAHRTIHRLSYERNVGPIPHGMTVDHLCFKPACANPAHLRLLTHLENSRNQRSAFKTHCVNGHEYTRENTYLRPGPSSGVRDCKRCIADRGARRAAKRPVGDGLSSRNTSGYRGVTWNKQKNRWQATAQLAGKSFFLGLHESLADAVAAREEYDRQNDRRAA